MKAIMAIMYSGRQITYTDTKMNEAQLFEKIVKLAEDLALCDNEILKSIEMIEL